MIFVFDFFARVIFEFVLFLFSIIWLLFIKLKLIVLNLFFEFSVKSLKLYELLLLMYLFFSIFFILFMLKFVLVNIALFVIFLLYFTLDMSFILGGSQKFIVAGEWKYFIVLLVFDVL